MNGNNFDRLEFIQNERNFKELGQSDNVLKDREPRQAWKPPLLLKIIALVLAVALVVVLAFSIFVHPIDKLKLALALGKNCEINMVAYGAFDKEEIIIKVDKNYFSMKIVGSQDEEYYLVKGDTVYKYEQDKNGEWEKVLFDEDLLEDGLDFEVLFDRRNYERVKGWGSVWRLKEGVAFGDYDTVEFCREKGKYKINATDAYSIGNTTYYMRLTITIGNIGKTEVTLPWTE